MPQTSRSRAATLALAPASVPPHRRDRPGPPPAAAEPRRRPRPPRRSRPTTPSTSTASRCATASGCSPPSTSPRTTSQTYPDPADAHALQRQALRRRPVPGRPRARRRCSARRATSSSTRTCAAAGCPRATFVNMRPHMPDKKGPTTSTRAPTPTTRSTGWSRTCRTTTARSGMWGISYPGFYTAAGMIDAHPALKAASPQAPVTDWFIGDDWHHNGALFLPHAFNFLANFGRPRPEPTTQVRRRRSTTTRRTATSSSCELGPLAERRRQVLQGRRRLLERGDEARHLRRVLEGPQPPAAPQGHQAGGDDRRRLVRRREPVRRPGDVTRTSRRTARRRRTSW